MNMSDYIQHYTYIQIKINNTFIAVVKIDIMIITLRKLGNHRYLLRLRRKYINLLCCLLAMIS